MRVLFVMRHSGFVRNFEALIAELAARGHEVHLAFELPREQAETAEALAAAHPGVSIGTAPLRSDRWHGLAYELRASIDALRYRTADYANAPKLRERGLRGAPSFVRALTAAPLLRHPRAIRALDRVLRRLLRAIPRDPSIDAYVASQRPDRVLVTPLVAGPTQDDVVRSARALGVPTALPVTSWDNLTNKGMIREDVDAVYVWNDRQRQEATRLHGVRPERVVATGAHSYDHWFAWAPSSDRDAFCERAGLPADRPIVLYLCSSKFIAPDEPAFVRRWLAGLRRGPAPLSGATVLVRPHPATGAWWDGVDLDGLGPVAVWPPTGADPRTEAAKRDYYDSMHHADVAVAVNTSAVIELAIVGRPAFTLLDADFRDTQQGTLHFAHLTEAGGGALRVARTPSEHHGQLAGTIAARDGSGAATREAFLREFVRPQGLDQPAAPLLADAIERLQRAPEPATRCADAVLRTLLFPLTGVVRHRSRKRPLSQRLGRWWRRRAKARRRLGRRWRKRVRALPPPRTAASRADGRCPSTGSQSPRRSRSALSRRRSARFARAIARAIIGAAILAKPAGSPRLRRVITVAPSPASCQE
jgi:hypothetical protein